MASRKTKLISTLSIAVVAAGGYLVYSAFATQGQGALAQAPLNLDIQVTPAFMMAVDDSGSMMFQNQFPGADGKACWSNDANGQPLTFFTAAGQLRADRRSDSTAAGHVCDFAYSYGGQYRLSDANNNWIGIPPIDRFGFARSHEFNPAYFNPATTYLPWLTSRGASYPAADPTAALIDPTDNVRTAASGSLANWTIDLTQTAVRSNSANSNGRLSDRFRLLPQMVVPAGTQIRTVNGNCGLVEPGSGSIITAAWKTLDADLVMPANTSCDVYIGHYLPTFFLRQDTPVPAGYEGVARELVQGACGAGCNMYRYTIAASNTAAMQNFANWFTYYGNRHKSLIAGLTRSLIDVNNMRVGYFRISQHASFDVPDLTSSTNPGGGGKRVHMRRMDDADDKDAIYTQVLANPGWSSTFNRQAVYAAGQQFKRTDPLNSTRGGAPVQLACQRNAMMLFTDGYSNANGPTVGNVDRDMGVPFTDGHSNTLADIATAYYLNTSSGQSPLRTDLPAGQVRPPAGCPSDDPSLNCQRNLHVNFYGVTLNGRGNLYDPDTVDFRDGYTSSAIYNNWPARQNDNRSTIDDIWHAAVNTRGELVNARTPADITAAMRRILGAVGQGTTPSGSIGVTGARIGSGSLTVIPAYESRNFATDWYSRLTAQRPATDPATGAITYSTVWEASERLPAPGERNVWYSRGATFAQFNSSAALTLPDLCSSPAPYPLALCNETALTDNMEVDIGGAIAYLLGDQSNEEDRAGGTGKLRYRTTRLGSIINSSPVLSAPTDDFGFRSLMSTDPVPVPDRFNYAAYLTTKATRRPMVYVGANDGMLHAFDGRTGVEGGIERFAYIPSTALGHMGNLLIPLAGKENDPDFQHRYFVDGPITVSDAYSTAWSSGGAGWRTVLVGTSGAGGRSVFGLNVSDPANFGAGSRLWEIGPGSTTAIQRDLGFVLGRPVVVPVKTRGGAVRWKAIFGNGYNSPNGNAVLFVVDIATGDVQRIQANEAGAPAGGTNGLGNIIAIDRYTGPNATLDLSGRDGYADTVYAADQKGAIWRFDLRDATPSNLTDPVFVTQRQSDGSRQPITGGLTAALAPGGGVMLYFGTGSFAFLGDKEDLSRQSLYGVIDRGSSDTLTYENLTEQTVTVGAAGSTARVVTRNVMGAGRRGWYLNLPTGERAVSHPRIENGIVFIPTYDPAVAEGCTGIGNNWLYGLNALSGGAALSGVSVGSPTGDSYGSTTGAVALATDGTAPVTDVAVMTSPRLPILAAGATEEALEEALAAQCSMLVQVAGAPPLYMPRACGRQSWRQIR